MPQPFLIAMGIAIVAVIGFVVSVGFASLTFGGIDFLFFRPKLTFLQSKKGGNGFAFSFKWWAAKDPARFDTIQIRLFNPFGSPTQVHIERSFEESKSEFSRDIDFGTEFYSLTHAKGIEKGLIQIVLSSSKDGLTYQFDYKASKFLDLLDHATMTSDEKNETISSDSKTVTYGVIPRDTIADTVPGKGPQIAIATNPAFAAFFQGAGGGGAAAGGDTPAAAQFAVSKVWIEDGCIVCDACEAIYEEVFEVTSDSCIIRAGAPLDDGLRIEEAAEACPVEVIKFTKAS